jgi:hypothetical protein
VDTNIIQLYIVQQDILEDARQAATNIEARLEEMRMPVREMARHMGQVPLVDEHPSPSAARYLVQSGGVERKKQRLTISWISFTCVAEGAPALADWLCAKGCTDLRYHFQSGFGENDD